MGWVLRFLQKWGERVFAGREREQRNLLRRKLRTFQQNIGHSIRNEEVFLQALLHRSFLQRMSHVGPSNERLEFLGDSVLNLIVAEYLFTRFPDAEEGDLTKLRSRLVNRKALATYGKELRLFDFIMMSDSAAHAAAATRGLILPRRIRAWLPLQRPRIPDRGGDVAFAVGRIVEVINRHNLAVGPLDGPHVTKIPTACVVA